MSANRPTPDSSPGHPLPGVVVYQVGTDGSLNGRWAHQPRDAANADPNRPCTIGTETAVGGTPMEVVGTYDVTIRNEQEDIIYRGKLQISPAGEGLRLRWTGQDLPSFEGIGLRVTGDLLVASYARSSDDARQ